MLGISAIMQEEAIGSTPWGCGEGDERLELQMVPAREIVSEWIVHFLVPGKNFWDNIGFT